MIRVVFLILGVTVNLNLWFSSHEPAPPSLGSPFFEGQPHEDPCLEPTAAATLMFNTHNVRYWEEIKFTRPLWIHLSSQLLILVHFCTAFYTPKFCSNFFFPAFLVHTRSVHTGVLGGKKAAQLSDHDNKNTSTIMCLWLSGCRSTKAEGV